MSMAQKFQIILTCDTEDKYGGVPNLLECDFGDAGQCGISYILEQLECRNFLAVFFVNIYEHLHYSGQYSEYIEKLCAKIAKKGHEIGLHAHMPLPDAGLDFYKSHIFYLNYDEIIPILRYGKEFILHYGGTMPTSFRGGGFGCNEDMFRALADEGFTVDSSACYRQRKDPHQALHHYRSLSIPTKIGNIIEFPVVPLINFAGEARLFDVNSSTYDELLGGINALISNNIYCAQIVFHSFSFIQKWGGEKDKVYFKFGKNKVYGISHLLINRFEKFLDFLHNNQDIEVVTFKQFVDTYRTLPDTYTDSLINLNKTPNNITFPLIYNAPEYNQDTDTNISNPHHILLDSIQNEWLKNVEILYLKHMPSEGNILSCTAIESITRQINKIAQNNDILQLPKLFNNCTQFIEELGFIFKYISEYRKSGNKLQYKNCWQLISTILHNSGQNIQLPQRNGFAETLAWQCLNLICFAKACEDAIIWADELFNNVSAFLRCICAKLNFLARNETIAFPVIGALSLICGGSLLTDRALQSIGWRALTTRVDILCDKLDISRGTQWNNALAILILHTLNNTTIQDEQMKAFRDTVNKHHISDANPVLQESAKATTIASSATRQDSDLWGWGGDNSNVYSTNGSGYASDTNMGLDTRFEYGIATEHAMCGHALGAVSMFVRDCAIFKNNFKELSWNAYSSEVAYASLSTLFIDNEPLCRYVKPGCDKGVVVIDSTQLYEHISVSLKTPTFTGCSQLFFLGDVILTVHKFHGKAPHLFTQNYVCGPEVAHIWGDGCHTFLGLDNQDYTVNIRNFGIEAGLSAFVSSKDKTTKIIKFDTNSSDVLLASAIYVENVQGQVYLRDGSVVNPHSINFIEGNNTWQIGDLYQIHCSSESLIYENAQLINSQTHYSRPICNMCGNHVNFENLGKRKNAKCPVCGALERHRAFAWLWYKYFNNMFPLRDKDLLHISPVATETNFLQKLGARITTLDQREEISTDLTADITKLDCIGDNSFDFIFCNHVFNFVKNYCQALSEFRRILKYKGILMLYTTVTTGHNIHYSKPPKDYFDETTYRKYGIAIWHSFGMNDFLGDLEKYFTVIPLDGYDTASDSKRTWFICIKSN